jgi:hypothetical protein
MNGLGTLAEKIEREKLWREFARFSRNIDEHRQSRFDACDGWQNRLMSEWSTSLQS